MAWRDIAWARRCRLARWRFWRTRGARGPRELGDLSRSGGVLAELETLHRALMVRHLERELRSLRVLRVLRAIATAWTNELGIALTFQDLIFKLQQFWAANGCLLQQPLDLEVGAGTSHPETLLRVLGPAHWNVAYVQPSRRPTTAASARTRTACSSTTSSR